MRSTYIVLRYFTFDVTFDILNKSFRSEGNNTIIAICQVMLEIFIHLILTTALLNRYY